MQLVFQALQAPRGLQEVLCQDLLLLSGVCGHGDGVPDLNQNGLTEGGRTAQIRLSSGVPQGFVPGPLLFTIL